MQLRTLRVENIRSYEHAELELPGGTTLLMGDVGAGKTSLLYAIEMALFGFAEVDPAFLVRHQAADAQVALTLEDAGHRYELRRRFRRKVSRGRETFQLESSSYSEDGVTKTYSTTELRQRTIELLGFPDNPNPRAHSDLWRWAVYIPQERMREILEQNPSVRLETVRKALGLEQYRVAAENAGLVAHELGQRAKHRRAEAAGLRGYIEEVDRWRRIGAEAAAERTAAEREEAQVRPRLAAHDAEVRRFELEIQQATAHRQERESAARRLAQLTRALEENVHRRGDLATLVSARSRESARRPDVVARLAVESNRLEDARRLRDASRQDLERLEGERAVVEAQQSVSRKARDSLGELGARLDRSRRELVERETELRASESTAPTREPPAPTPRTSAEIGEEIREMQSRAEGFAGELARAELVSRDLVELLQEGRCPRCHQTVRPEEFDVHRAEADARVEQARLNVRAAADRRTHLEEERRARERFDRAHQNWEHAEARRRDLRRELDAARKRVEELESQVTAVKLELERSEERASEQARIIHQRDEAARRLADTVRNVDALSESCGRLSQEVERLRVFEADVDRLRSELARLDSEISERHHELTETTDRLKQLDSALSDTSALEGSLETARAARAGSAALLDQLHARIGAATRSSVHASEQLERAEDGARRGRELETDADRLDRLATWLTRPFREAMESLEQRVLTRAQSEFERAYSRYFHSLVDDPALVARCDSAFSPAVEINGEWTPAEALSGGERTALALAYRLALGHVVRAFGQLTLETLILDEPTDGFSAEQVSRMGELLDELGLPQVILVSHEGGLGAVADRVVRVRKEGGASTLTTEDETRTGSGPPIPAATQTPPPRPRRRRITVEDASARVPTP
ncbi:MAG TPA: SMC family ATPase [Thermoplasmata archaeon]|nr:SMC family ATPase [Thermoplasmata archaeon]